MARPSFQFYPDDWMNDLGLRGCSPATRGIWADVLCMMHQGIPYGHLADAAGAIPVKNAAIRCGVSLKTFMSAMAELESHQVFSRTDEGIVFSRRMVRDEHNRNVRGKGGIKSLMSDAVPRPKGILQGIHTNGADKPSFGPEDEEEVCGSPVILRKATKASWEEINEAWKWYKAEYPGDVNEFVDMKLFISVMETQDDIADLYKNLPLWKQTRKWLEGFHKESKNFISERVFKITPKVREPTVIPKTKQQENSDGWSRA